MHRSRSGSALTCILIAGTLPKRILCSYNKCKSAIIFILRINRGPAILNCAQSRCYPDPRSFAPHPRKATSRCVGHGDLKRCRRCASS